MSRSAISRRAFLTEATAGIATGLGSLEQSCSIIDESSEVIKVRKNITTLTPDETKVLSDAVKEMKNRDENDKKGWESIARIHKDTCPHGNWFFLPWHRAYLYYFEEICREVSGKKEFTLPYWNWTADRKIPNAFLVESLLDDTRKSPPDGSEEFLGQSVVDKIVKDVMPFTSSFGGGKATKLTGGEVRKGELESRPHDYIHVNFVGGHMRDVLLSPLDPIFFVHHANVDRLWTEWVKYPRHVMPKDNDWLELSLPFVGKDGKTQLKVKDVLSTFQLGYRYDTQAMEKPAILLASEVREVPDYQVLGRGGRPFTAMTPWVSQLDPPNALIRKLGEMTLTQAKGPPNGDPGGGVSGRVRLAISIAKPPKAEQEFFVRAFLNYPERLSIETSVNDPHYVGSFAFFGVGERGHEMNMRPGSGLTVYLDITTALRKQTRQQAMETIRAPKVQLVPVPVKRGDIIKWETDCRVEISYIPLD